MKSAVWFWTSCINLGCSRAEADINQPVWIICSQSHIHHVEMGMTESGEHTNVHLELGTSTDKLLLHHVQYGDKAWEFCYVA